MGFLSRRTESTASRPVWEAPLESRDPVVLYQRGIGLVSTGDGMGMIRIGWALWDLAGLERNQAWDFIYDGYHNWTESGALTSERVALARAVLARLENIRPVVLPTTDISTLDPDVAARVAVYYGARSWAGSELVDAFARSGMQDRTLIDEAYTTFASTHRDFMPPRSIRDFETLEQYRN